MNPLYGQRVPRPLPLEDYAAELLGATERKQELMLCRRYLKPLVLGLEEDEVTSLAFKLMGAKKYSTAAHLLAHRQILVGPEPALEFIPKRFINKLAPHWPTDLEPALYRADAPPAPEGLIEAISSWVDEHPRLVTKRRYSAWLLAYDHALRQARDHGYETLDPQLVKQEADECAQSESDSREIKLLALRVGISSPWQGQSSEWLTVFESAAHHASQVLAHESPSYWPELIGKLHKLPLRPQASVTFLRALSRGQSPEQALSSTLIWAYPT